MRFFATLALAAAVVFTPLRQAAAQNVSPDTYAAVTLPTPPRFTEEQADRSTTDYEPAAEAVAPETAATDPTSLRPLTRQQRLERGRADARRFYKPAKGMFWAGVGSGYAVMGGVGVVSAAALATTPPSQTRLVATAPHPELLQDADYRLGYEQAARRKRLLKVLAGTGIGAATAAATLGLVIMPAMAGL